MPTIDEFKASLPDVQTAQQVFEDIKNQAFFAKLADHGITPRDDEQAQTMLRTAKLAEQLAAHPSVQRTPATDPYAALEQGVLKVAAQMGVRQDADAQAGLLDQIALGFASHPAVYGAALSLSHNGG